ncbi:hypothetical protein INT43_000765 [Umbelopsis isabellina]|uniref:Nucleolus and neural progenitor protein-like N-terminal domain-containing protein n=1 Tax=Mortierella isabellina TaxID=91625 RepID=A0A8H7UK96_MORIS|nr:hypothetical protein INT43_000765 [Umbelopsis isabellina]
MQAVLQRDISECNVRTVPVAAVTESKVQENSPQLRQLLAYVKLFRKQDFWTEVALWERIYYKNVNQHRQSRCFKKFGEVRKLFKRLKEVNPSTIIAKLYSSFYDGNPLAKCKGPITSIPTDEYINYSLHRIISATLLLDRIQVVCMETYRSHQHLLNKKYFLPLTLVIMSLCCRIYTACKQWGVEIEDFYDLMINWKDDFASSPDSGAMSYSIDKEMLKNARLAASEEFFLRRASEYQPVHLESGNISLDIHQVKADLNLRETVDQISKDSGNVMMDEDYGEILSRDDEQLLSKPEEVTIEQEIVSVVYDQKMEPVQKTEKKRKADNEIASDTAKLRKTLKPAISKIDKVKLKKKTKAAIERRDKNDSASSSTQSSVQESKVKNGNVNSNIDAKPKTKSKAKAKGIQEKRSKGNSMDEIDDIFGF